VREGVVLPGSRAYFAVPLAARWITSIRSKTSEDLGVSTCHHVGEHVHRR